MACVSVSWLHWMRLQHSRPPALPGRISLASAFCSGRPRLPEHLLQTLPTLYNLLTMFKKAVSHRNEHNTGGGAMTRCYRCRRRRCDFFLLTTHEASHLPSSAAKGAGSYLAGMAVAIPILNVDGRRHTNNFSKNI